MSYIIVITIINHIYYRHRGGGAVRLADPLPQRQPDVPGARRPLVHEPGAEIAKKNM